MGGHDTSKNSSDFISWKLAEWAANLSYEDLSPEAVQSAKLYLFDSFGCALGGSLQHDVEMFLDHARQMGGAAGADAGERRGRRADRPRRQPLCRQGRARGRLGHVERAAPHPFSGQPVVRTIRSNEFVVLFSIGVWGRLSG